jgi:hypothetical protein
MINATQTPCAAGFQIGVMRVINRFASVPASTKAVPSALFDRYREAYRRVAQSRICTTVLLLAQKDAWGVRPLRTESLTRNYSRDRPCTQSMSEYLHQFFFVATHHQLVVERLELLVIEFYPC